MGTKHVAKLAALTSLLLASVTAWADPIFDVSLDTSSISGTVGQVVFELVDGDGVVDNSVALSGFSFGGGAIAGAADYLGTSGVTGDLSGSIAMDDSGGLAVFTQPLTFGSSLMFAMTATNNFLSLGSPDAFSMALLTSDFSACYSDDQNSCALLQLDLTGEPLTVASFTLNGAMAQSLPAPVVTVPEPASLLLLASGIAILLPFGRRTTGCA